MEQFRPCPLDFTIRSLGSRVSWLIEGWVRGFLLEISEGHMLKWFMGLPRACWTGRLLFLGFGFNFRQDFLIRVMTHRRVLSGFLRTRQGIAL